MDTCQQHSNTTCRSGQSDFLCDHLKSTQFIGTSAVIADHLKEESLDFVVNRFKWLNTERRSECLHWQNQARINIVPLVVQMPITPAYTCIPLIDSFIFQCSPTSRGNITGHFGNGWWFHLTRNPVHFIASAVLLAAPVCISVL